MKRAIVIGSPGSGKSTFARGLRDATGLPLYYLDMLYHLPDRTTAAREVFDARLGEILARERWIIDGNYSRTMKLRLAACDTVFWLNLPAEVCLAGARERVGQAREDMPWAETELDEEFRQYIERFPETDAPRIAALLERCGEGRRVAELRSREEMARCLEEIRAGGWGR